MSPEARALKIRGLALLLLGAISFVQTLISVLTHGFATEAMLMLTVSFAVMAWGCSAMSRHSTLTRVYLASVERERWNREAERLRRENRYVTALHQHLSEPRHVHKPEPVVLITGETVGHVCADCLQSCDPPKQEFSTSVIPLGGIRGDRIVSDNFRWDRIVANPNLKPIDDEWGIGAEW